MNWLDIVGGLLVIACIILRFKRRQVWLLYAVGCGIYVFINMQAKLWGQVSINIAGVIVSIINYFSEKPKETSK